MIRPIHFSVPMVRALIDGRKTQTRRLGSSVHAGRVQVGDQLWVREAYRLEPRFDGFDSPLKAAKLEGKPLDYEYEAHIATGEPIVGWGKQRTARTMPKIFSRIILTVTEVRRQLLQDIGDHDARCEGVERARTKFTDPGGDRWRDYLLPEGEQSTLIRPRESYSTLWDAINAPKMPWSSNPEVIAITFTHRLERITDVEAQLAEHRCSVPDCTGDPCPGLDD